MKKLGILIVILLVVAMYILPVQAQSRGSLPNQWASWASINSTSKTFTFPSNSRDLWIHNGSAVDIFVDIKGNAIDANGYKGGILESSTFQLNGTESVYLQDIVTPAISVKSTTAATASPVSVLVTY